MHGSELKQRILQNGVKLWQVAAMLGITDSTFSRKLRFDWSEADTKRVLEIVECLKKETL